MEETLKYLAPVLGIIVNFLLLKIFKQKKNQEIIDRIIEDIIELIYDIEELNNRTGEQKRAEVSRTLFRTLSGSETRRLKGKYGSIENAVQVAFRKTVLSHPKSSTKNTAGGKQNG